METLFLIGRIIFGGFFVYNAINHFKNAQAMTEYARYKAVPSPKFAVLGGGVLLLLGGLGIIFEIYPDIALILLLLFLVPTTFLMHQYWKAEGGDKQTEQIQFTKNLGLIGALLMMFLLPW